MSENNIRRKFDKTLLSEVIQRDNAILIGDYKKLTRNSIITFHCNCSKQNSKAFRCIADLGGAFCNECNLKLAQEKHNLSCLQKYGVEHQSKSEQVRQKTINTYIEKYGVDHPCKSKDVQEKRKNTFIEKYGVDHPCKSKEIQDKIKQTNIEKYGVDNVFKNEEIKNKIIEKNINNYGVANPFSSEVIKNKIKQTNLEKYGVEHPVQNNEIKEKIKNTCRKKYGVDNPLQNIVIHTKFIDTMNERYGVNYALENKELLQKQQQTFFTNYGCDHPSKSEYLQEKRKQTCLIKYGIEHPIQNKIIFEKSINNSAKIKEYTMPSGQIRKVQGYEPFALNDLIKLYTENEILTGRNDVPRIKYTLENKTKYYFPDIYIPKENKIIEVKSIFTRNYKSDLIKVKEDATVNEGYLYEIWVYDKNGIRIS